MPRVVYIKLNKDGTQKVTRSNVKPSKAEMKKFLETTKVLENTMSTYYNKSKLRVPSTPEESAPQLASLHKFLGPGKALKVFHNDPNRGNSGPPPAKKGSLASWLLYPAMNGGWVSGVRTSAIAVTED